MQRLLQRCRPLYQNRDFRVILVLNTLLGLAYSFIGPFISMFGTREVGMSSLLFGVFMSVTALGGIVLGTTLAHYSDTRVSRRTMLLLGSVCGALGYLGYAFVRDFRMLLLIGALVLGISGTTFAQVFALAREYIRQSDIPEKQTAFYMNAFRMAFALSWTVGPAMAAWIMIGYSYRGIFLCASGCFCLFFLVVWLSVPAVSRSPLSTDMSRQGSVFQLLRRGDVLAHFVGFVLIFASQTIGMMNLPLLVLNVLGGSEYHVGIIYSIAPIFELPLMFYFGVLAGRMDPARIIRLGVIFAVAYYGLLSIVQAPWHIYPIQILSAATVAVTAGLAITYFQNYLPHHPGSATNLYSNAMRIGSTIGYLLFGTLAWNFGYRAVFVTCTAFTLVSLALLCVPRRPDEPDTERALARSEQWPD